MNSFKKFPQAHLLLVNDTQLHTLVTHVRTWEQCLVQGHLDGVDVAPLLHSVTCVLRQVVNLLHCGRYILLTHISKERPNDLFRDAE